MLRVNSDIFLPPWPRSMAQATSGLPCACSSMSCPLMSRIAKRVPPASHATGPQSRVKRWPYVQCHVCSGVARWQQLRAVYREWVHGVPRMARSTCDHPKYSGILHSHSIDDLGYAFELLSRQ